MSNLNEEEDLDIIKRFLAGHKEAFEILVKKYQERAYYLAYRLTRNHHDADDLSQDAFLKVYNSLDKFKGRSAFFTWLYRIVVNIYINDIRGKPRIVNKRVEEFRIAASGRDALSLLEDKEVRLKVETAVEHLPLRQRVAFTLRSLEGLSFKEVSGSMGCSEGAAKANYFQAVRKVRKYLKELFEYSESKR